jgi:hypothetical protein
MSVRKAFVNISSAILGLTVMGGNVMAQDQKACKTAVEAFDKVSKGMTAAMQSGNEKKVESAGTKLGEAAGKIGEACGLPVEDTVNLSMLPMAAMPDVADQPGMADLKAKGDAAMLKARQAAGLTK